MIFFRYAIIVMLLVCLPIASKAKVIDMSKAPAYPALYEPESLTVDSPPDLVLLGADLVEIAVALGGAGRILARPDPIDLPGISGTPNRMREWAGVEGVAALRPGLVIGSSVINRRLLDGLKSIGIETDLIDRTLPAIDKVARMAKHLKAEERGAALIANIEQDYKKARAPKINGRPIRILHASKMGAGSNFTAGGAETAVHNLIERVGALNAAAEIGRDRYRPITPEGVMAMAPDVVIISAAEIASFGNLDTFWRDYPGLAFTPAAENKNLIIMRELHVRADAASSGIASARLATALKELFE